jgi:CcmD family protein
MPALPLDEAGKYVAAAYVVFFTLVVVYVAIMAAKIQRIDRELSELVELAERDRGASDGGAAGTPSAAQAEPTATPSDRDGDPVA